MSLVSWKNNFADQLSSLIKAENENARIDIVGIGGGDAGMSAAVILDILRVKKYDLVIIDVLARSGAASGLSKRPRFFLEAVKSTISRIVASGAQPLVLEMYRAAVNPDTDPIFPEISKYCSDNSVPCIDLAAKIRALPLDVRKDFFVDTTHTTKAGAEYYGKALFDYLKGMPHGELRKTQDIGPPSMYSITVQGSPLGYSVSQFSRTGYSSKFTEVPERESITLTFRSERRFVGLVLAYGPLSGNMLIGTTSSPAMRRICAYDKNSYYERANFVAFPPFYSDNIVITQLPGVPTDIVLLKGEVNQSARIGKISHIMWAGSKVKID